MNTSSFLKDSDYKNVHSRIWKVLSPLPIQTWTVFPRGNLSKILLVSFLCIDLYLHINTSLFLLLLSLLFPLLFSHKWKNNAGIFLAWIFHLVVYFIDLSMSTHRKLLNFKWMHLSNSINISKFIQLPLYGFEITRRKWWQ